MSIIIIRKPWYFYALALLFFSIGNLVLSQNKIEQVLSSKSVEKVVINGNQIFKIDIATLNSSKIWFSSSIDGEYQEQFQITHNLDKGILSLQIEENPLINIPDDKRNAHKVIAAELQLRIPDYLNVDVVSDIGSVQLTGTFNNLSVQVLEGYCNIIGHAQYAMINSVEGDILIKTTKGTFGANSRYGTIEIDNFENKVGIWELKTIRGNITVVNKK